MAKSAAQGREKKDPKHGKANPSPRQYLKQVETAKKSQNRSQKAKQASKNNRNGANERAFRNMRQSLVAGQFGKDGKKAGRRNSPKEDIRKNNHKKRPPPKMKMLRLPETTQSNHGVLPWMKDEYWSAFNPHNKPITRTVSKTLPTKPFADRLLAFDREVMALANYVKLSENEMKLRHYFVGQVQEMAQQLAPQSQHLRFQRRRDDDDEPEEVTVRVFGSFATPDVCTFMSDVDLALHGVVPVPKPPPPPEKEPLAPPPPPSAKHAKLQKWRDALASADQDNMLTPDIIRLRSESMVSQQSSGTARLRSESFVSQQSVGEPLFVLDRVGLTVEKDSNDQNPIAANDDRKPAAVNNPQHAVVKISGLPELAPSDGAAEKGASVASSHDSADLLIGTSEMPIELEDDESSEDSHAHLVDKGEDSMEVGFVAAGGLPRMTKNLRNEITSKLGRFSNILRKSRLTWNVLCIRTARVPIVKMHTALGFESDVAIGGHVGTDTSKYALSQIQRFHSFAPVVMVLKILLQQQDLDVPFAGGLGSYKLYVLVAHHISQHLANGGADNPGEILLSFLYRYGSTSGKDHTYRLTMNTELIADEGLDIEGRADLSNVFHIPAIVRLFRLLWGRLSHTVQTRSRDLLLPLILHVEELKQKREACLASSTECARKFGLFKEKGKRKSSPRANYRAKKAKGSLQEEEARGCLTADELIASFAS